MNSAQSASRPPTDWASPKMRARIARRYRSESIFRNLGLFALVLAASFLVFLLVTVVRDGWQGFLSTDIKISATYDPAVLGIDPAAAKGPDAQAALQAGDFQAVMAASVAKLGDDADAVSEGAWLVLRRQLMDEIGAGDLAWGPGVAAATLLAGRMSGVASLRLATMVAEASARALVGHGLTMVGVGGSSRVLGAALGPIGWAVTGLWTLADLSAPAYRVTVPCVVQVAYIRQKMLMQMTHATCSCGSQVMRSAKFCQECGSTMKLAP